MAILKPKDGHKVLPEIIKLIGNINLVKDRGWARGEPRTSRLIDVDHIGEIGPRVRVPYRRRGTRLPQHRSVLLQKPYERTAPRSSIQPDGDLTGSLGVAGGEEPKEEARVAGRTVGEKAGVGFAEVEVKSWECGAVDEEACGL